MTDIRPSNKISEENIFTNQYKQIILYGINDM